MIQALSTISICLPWKKTLANTSNLPPWCVSGAPFSPIWVSPSKQLTAALLASAWECHPTRSHLLPFLVPVAGKGGGGGNLLHWKYMTRKEEWDWIVLQPLETWYQLQNSSGTPDSWSGLILPSPFCLAPVGTVSCFALLMLSWLHLCPATKAKPGISRELIYRSTFTDC